MVRDSEAKLKFSRLRPKDVFIETPVDPSLRMSISDLCFPKQLEVYSCLRAGNTTELGMVVRLHLQHLGDQGHRVLSSRLS